jgi:hypothetical protein
MQSTVKLRIVHHTLWPCSKKNLISCLVEFSQARCLLVQLRRYSVTTIKAVRGRLPPLVLPSVNLHRPLAFVNLHRPPAHAHVRPPDSPSPTPREPPPPRLPSSPPLSRGSFTSTPFRGSHQHALRRDDGPSSETRSSPSESSPSLIPTSRLPSMSHLHHAPPASAGVVRAPTPPPRGARRDKRPPRRHRERVAQQSLAALTRPEP